MLKVLPCQKQQPVITPELNTAFFLFAVRENLFPVIKKTCMKLKIKDIKQKSICQKTLWHVCQQKKGKAQTKILAAVCPLTASTAAQYFIFQFTLVLIFKCYC